MALGLCVYVGFFSLLTCASVRFGKESSPHTHSLPLVAPGFACEGGLCQYRRAETCTHIPCWPETRYDAPSPHLVAGTLDLLDGIATGGAGFRLRAYVLLRRKLLTDARGRRVRHGEVMLVASEMVSELALETTYREMLALPLSL